MKFNVEKMKEISRPMTESERQEIENRNENHDWLALSAKFALLLRYILRTEKISQTELAGRMGVSCARISNLLSGKENIGLQTIAKVEKALGRSLVSFADSSEHTYSSRHQPSFTQVFSFSVYYQNPERRIGGKTDSTTFSSFSTGKILV